MGCLARSFGRYTQVPLWLRIKQAGVFNPERPLVTVLSFSPLWLQVLTAIWQCQAAATDAMCSKGHSFIPHIKQVLIFHSLRKNIKNLKGLFELQAKSATTAAEDSVHMRWNTKGGVFFSIIK